MASQLVLEALESLHQELDKMQPAIRQVELAEQVMAEARKIPEHYLKLVSRIEEQEAQFKQKLAAELDEHADLVRKEVGTLVTEAGNTINNLTKHEEHFGVIQKRMEPLVNQLSSLQLEPRLDKLQSTADNKFDQLAGSAEILQKGVKGIQDRLNASEVTIGNRLTEEGKTRRDQLESNANAIKLEVRQLIDKLKALETALSDQLYDHQKKQAEQANAIREEVSGQGEKVQDGFERMLGQFEQVRVQLDVLHQQQQIQKSFTYITWALIAIATAAIILFVKFN